MNWQNIKDGYEFKLYFQHGQHSSHVVETIKCSLNEEDFQKHVKILQYLGAGIDKHSDSYTEKVAEYIVQKTGLGEKEVLNIIMPVVLCDIKFEENMARLDYIEVYRYEDGKVQISQI